MPRRYRRRRRVRRTRNATWPGQVFTKRPAPMGNILRLRTGKRLFSHFGWQGGFPITRNVYANGAPSNFPKVTKMKLKYDCEFSLNSGAVTYGDKVFRANDPFDPEYSVGGHSAYLFDEMMGFYGKYRVISSKIRVWYINPAVSDQIPFYLTIVRSKDPSITAQFASTDHILESNMHGAIKICGQFSTANQIMQSQPATVTMTYSQRKYFPGIKDEQFEGLYNTDPALEAYFHVLQFPLAGNDPPTAYFRAEIQFNVIFSELIILPESGVNALTGVEATPGGTGPIGSYALNSVNQTLGGFTGAGGAGQSIPSLLGGL